MKITLEDAKGSSPTEEAPTGAILVITDANYMLH